MIQLFAVEWDEGKITQELLNGLLAQYFQQVSASVQTFPKAYEISTEPLADNITHCYSLPQDKDRFISDMDKVLYKEWEARRR